MIVIDPNGHVSKTFKGPADEINNEILATFDLHIQQFPNPVRSKVQRVVPTKVVKGEKSR
jgi:hypothetical protein